MTATFPSTVTGLDAALVALGATGSQVAETLSAGGWRGIPSQCTACPVATYLRAVVERARVAHVDANEISVQLADGFTLRTATPVAVYEFVSAFDYGRRYQDLAERKAA